MSTTMAGAEAAVPEVPTSLVEPGGPTRAADRRERPPMVLHVRVVTGNGGGPEKTILNSPRFLRELGYQSKLAYLHPPHDPGWETLCKRAADAGAEILSIPDRGPLDLSVVVKLARLCQKERVDLWHGHDYKSNLLGLLVSLLRPLQLVTTLHGWTNLSGRVPLYVQIDKWCLKYYRAAICVSDDLITDCRFCKVPAHRCHLIHNAIDTDDYCRSRSADVAKSQLGFTNEGLLVGSVGRLSPEKGYDLLIRAIVELQRAGKKLSLWIAGDGDARRDLESLIRTLDCSTYVRLLGHVPDPRIFFEAMDLFVLSSRREGLPNVLLEAMALKTPVVATRVAGVPRVVTDGCDGLLIRPDDIGELMAAIDQLAENPRLRASLAAEGRKTVESRFSFARRMEKVAAVYDELLARPSGKRTPAGTGPALRA